LEAGEIAFTRVGRHRRVRYADLLAYMEKSDRGGCEAVDALAAQAQELGMGY
jgi:hypothetical protein